MKVRPNFARVRAPLVALFLLLALACRPEARPPSLPTATVGTPAAVATAVASPSLTPVSPAPVQTIPTPPDRDPVELARRLRLRQAEPIDVTPAKTPPEIREGDRLTLWVLRERGGGRQAPAVVRRVSANAIWIFDESMRVEPGKLDASIAEFESRIWPRVMRLFPAADRIGLDGDRRITIFHTELDAGMAGYFSSSDAYPRAVHPFSNERSIIYMDGKKATLATEPYYGLLTHELQHALHHYVDPTEDTWINEGLSELAVYLLGYPTQSVQAYVADPNSQLNAWPDDRNTGSNYGGALLFLQYLHEHYGGDAIIQALIADPLDGLAGVDSSLRRSGRGVPPLDVFRDWVVANLLGESGTAFGYEGREPDLVPVTRLNMDSTRTGVASQMGVMYYEVPPGRDRVTIRFEGEPSTALISQPGGARACWWTNQGDSINTTLTREVDLSATPTATLKFSAWYQIEEEWDYAYVEVSTDGGTTWQVLDGLHTTARNANGNAFGSGYTGRSQRWVEERIDLTPFAGKRVLLRLEYITDDAIYLQGACFNGFEIPEIGWADLSGSDSGWLARGFTRISDRIPQEWLVQVVRVRDGQTAVVLPLPVSHSGTGLLTVNEIVPGERLYIAVSALTPASMVPAHFSLGVAGSPGSGR